MTPNSTQQQGSSPPQQPVYAEVQTVLALSLPRRSVRNLLPFAGAIMLGVLVMLYLTTTSATSSGEITFAVLFFASLLVIWIVLANILAIRALQNELARIDVAAELMQLRRWDQAGMMLQNMLLASMRTHGTRAQALVLLAGVFGRLRRFDDALTILDHLLEAVDLDLGSRHRIKLARAQSLLHEDRLVDADAAIADLRRDVAEVTRAIQDAAGYAAQKRERADDDSETAPPVVDAADDTAAPALVPELLTMSHRLSKLPPPNSLLALVELHRDVKTGHVQEAIAGFRAHIGGWTQLLSHRVADAYALVACAYDHAGDRDQAQAMYARATLLCPAGELGYRFREVASLSQRYTASAAPREVWT